MNKQNKAILCLLATYIILCVWNISLSAATNTIWNYKYNKDVFRNRSYSPSDFIKAVEMESRRVDPGGNGVMILFKVDPDENSNTLLKYTDCESLETLADVLYSGVALMNMDCIIVNNAAIIGRQNIRSVACIITGRCYDSESGAQIKEFRIESFPWNGIMTEMTNGYYLCSLPCQIKVNINDDIIFMPATSNFWKQEVTVRADGYKPRKYILDILRPGKTPYINLDIELEMNAEESGGVN